MAGLPSREEYVAGWSALHGGYDAQGSALVGGWLRVLYPVARALAAAGVAPNLLTLLGPVLAGGAVWAAWSGAPWAAVVLVALSGFLDGLDGAVAVVSARATAWGAVLDSMADRCSDLLLLLALWAAGAPAGACAAAGALLFLLEYLRARAAFAGMAEIGVVTVGERPARVVITAVFLGLGAVRGADAARWAELGAWTTVVVCAVGLVQLGATVRRRLGRAGVDGP